MPRAKRQSTVDPNETKADKFKRLANGRLASVVPAIERIGKLGSSGYERTPEQVAAIRSILSNAVKTACDKLEPRSGGAGKVGRKMDWLP